MSLAQTTFPEAYNALVTELIYFGDRDSEVDEEPMNQFMRLVVSQDDPNLWISIIESVRKRDPAIKIEVGVEPPMGRVCSPDALYVSATKRGCKWYALLMPSCEWITWVNRPEDILKTELSEIFKRVKANQCDGASERTR